MVYYNPYIPAWVVESPIYPKQTKVAGSHMIRASPVLQLSQSFVVSLVAVYHCSSQGSVISEGTWDGIGRNNVGPKISPCNSNGY